MIVGNISEPRSEGEQQAALQGYAAVTPGAADPTRCCPVCGRPLEPVNYDKVSGMIVENCYDHGVWLDSGELERAEAWIEAASKREGPAYDLVRRYGELTAEMDEDLDRALKAHRGGRFGGVLRRIASAHGKERDKRRESL